MTYTVGELFAGIGGFSLAFHSTGMAETAWFVEKEEYPQKVLRKNFPGVPVYGDIYECHDLPYVDVMTAGFPCQPFSIAGSGNGSRDKRYLVPEMLRIIQEVHPRVVYLENVPRFTTLHDGVYFRYLLRAIAEMGMDAQWYRRSAHDVGAPHLRERWFCVAYSVSDRYAKTGCTQQTAHHQKRNPTAHQQSRDAISSPFVAGGQVLRSKRRRIVPGVDGAAHGLPARLDRHQWPARPGQPQYDWEPPRVTTRLDHRTDRLKALGNAVVPQVIYPIAQSICEWLAAQDATEGVEVA